MTILIDSRLKSNVERLKQAWAAFFFQNNVFACPAQSGSLSDSVVETYTRESEGDSTSKRCTVTERAGTRPLDALTSLAPRCIVE